MEAIADDFAAAPGDEILVRTTIVNRSDQPFVLHRLGIPRVLPDSVVDKPLKNNEPLTIENKVLLPKDFPLSQPYWLEPSPQNAPFSAGDRSLMGRAENPPSLSVALVLSIDGRQLEYSIPVLFRWTDQVQGELYRPFEVRPRVTIRVEDGVKIFPGDGPQQVKIRLKSHSKNVAGTDPAQRSGRLAGRSGRPSFFPGRQV